MLVLPTYGGGRATPDINDGGYVPKQVIAFLNNEHNRSLIRGVIAAGNNNFGTEFAYAGDVVSRQVRSSVPVPIRTDGNPGRRGSRPRGTCTNSGRTRRATNRHSCRACNLRRAGHVARFERRRGRLPRAQRDAEPLRRRRQDSVRKGPGSRAPVLPRARQPEHGVLPRHRREARLPDQGELLRARGARPVLAQLRQDAAGPGLCQEVPLPDVPRRVQVLHQLHAEDVRREALPRAVRGPCRHGVADAGRGRHDAGREARRRDHRRPVPAGHSDVPQLGQEAARRAGELLPAAHRGQHGVHRALHQLGAAAVQARRRSCVAAQQHPRARRTHQEHREPELGRHPDHEAARGLVLLRQPARRAPRRRCGVPAGASPRHLSVPRHQARERRREDPHQDAAASAW